MIQRTPIILDKQICVLMTNLMDTSYHGSGMLLEIAYKKYGVENFEVSILDWTDLDDTALFEKEYKKGESNENY